MSFNTASELSETALKVPFPTAQRRSVFLATHSKVHSDILARAWTRWAGGSEYVWQQALDSAVNSCGVVIYVTGDCNFPTVVYQMIQRGCDVFEYCLAKKHFERIRLEDFIRLYPHCLEN